MKSDDLRHSAVNRCTSFTILAAALSLFVAQQVHATPAFSKQTGKACADCHKDPKGGTVLTPLGAQFKADGNKLVAPKPEAAGTKPTP